MNPRVEEPHFLPAARQDIADAFAWYEQQGSGLGLDFLRHVEAVVAEIQRHPAMYPAVLDDYRRALVRRFPYVIFYAVEPERIVVYAVFHCSQNPDKWKVRLLN
ncbi:MAG: type II toxin-antitoxin system RelE/ParE family toxin [Sedimentisphaerales bacterium]|nr:type II toxin-antitoxin system RelE/ParE family toxin [Sedimentisphaerales bacterium]